MGALIIPEFYDNQHFFQSWNDTQLDLTRFVFRKGDVLLFGGGHTMIVVGDNLYDNVVVSQMSWNRTKQDYDARGLDFYGALPGAPDYGVTRDRLKRLRDPSACPSDMVSIFQKPFRAYRLRRYLGNYRALQLFDSPTELPPEGTTFKTHLIKSGETLTKIAKQESVTLDSLVKANGIKIPGLIYAGDELIVP